MNKTFRMSSVAAALVLSGVLVGCGSSSSSSSGGGGTDPNSTDSNATTTKSISLVALDGYISGATISEAKGASATIANNSAGMYTATVSKELNETAAQFKSTGGCIDVNGDGSCGTGDLTAPALTGLVGGKVLNPFTTLIADGNATSDQIKSAFKIGADTDLTGNYLSGTTYDASTVKAAVYLGRVMVTNASQSANQLFASIQTATAGLDANATTDKALQTIADNNATSDVLEAIAEAIIAVPNASVEANGSKAIEANTAFIGKLPTDQKVGYTPPTTDSNSTDIVNDSDVHLPTI